MQNKEPRRNVTLHGAGMGVATEEDIENRARELALLDLLLKANLSSKPVLYSD